MSNDRIGFRIEPELKKMFDEYCWRNRTTKTEVLLGFIEELCVDMEF